MRASHSSTKRSATIAARTSAKVPRNSGAVAVGSGARVLCAGSLMPRELRRRELFGALHAVRLQHVGQRDEAEKDTHVGPTDHGQNGVPRLAHPRERLAER